MTVLWSVSDVRTFDVRSTTDGAACGGFETSSSVTASGLIISNELRKTVLTYREGSRVGQMQQVGTDFAKTELDYHVFIYP